MASRGRRKPSAPSASSRRVVVDLAQPQAGQRVFAGFRVGEDLPRNAADLAPVVVRVRASSAMPVGEAHAPRRGWRGLAAVARQHVRLLVIGVLQAVFETAQEDIGRRAIRLGLRREQRRSASSASTASVGRVCSAGSRPPRMSWKTWAMNSISRMPPGPSLMWSAMSLRTTSRRICACRSRMALIAPKSRYLRKTNGRGDALQRPDPVLGAGPSHSGRVHDARLDPGVALPFAALGHEVVLERVERADQRPGVAVRAQPHVDAEDLAVGGDFAERGDQALAEAGEEVVVLDPLRPGGVAILGVDEDVVDVGRDVQLAAAELAHADHHQPLRLAGPVERLADRWRRAGGGEVERHVGGDVGEQRHAFDHFGQRGEAAQVTQRDVAIARWRRRRSCLLSASSSPAAGSRPARSAASESGSSQAAATSGISAGLRGEQVGEVMAVSESGLPARVGECFHDCSEGGYAEKDRMEFWPTPDCSDLSVFLAKRAVRWLTRKPASPCAGRSTAACAGCGRCLPRPVSGVRHASPSGG